MEREERTPAHKRTSPLEWPRLLLLFLVCLGTPIGVQQGTQGADWVAILIISLIFGVLQSTIVTLLYRFLVQKPLLMRRRKFFLGYLLFATAFNVLAVVIGQGLGATYTRVTGEPAPGLRMERP